MRRKLFLSVEGPERQLNEREYWIDFMLNQAGEVVHYDDPFNHTPVTDFVFYVWGPDITKRWPNITKPSPEGKGSLAVDDDGDVSTIERRKPGPQARHDWPTVIARELIRRAKAGEKDPTAAELAQFCLNKWDWQPDISALQRLLKQLLGFSATLRNSPHLSASILTPRPAQR